MQHYGFDFTELPRNIQALYGTEYFGKPKASKPQQQPSNGVGGQLIGNSKETQPQKPKTRKKKVFLDRVRNGHDDIIAILHSLMKGKTGKDALVYLTACIKEGIIIRPTYQQTIEEFGTICEKANYYRYTDPDRYTSKELAAATKAISYK